MTPRRAKLLKLHAEMSEKLKQFRRQKAEESLYEFVRQFWHVVEPANPLIEGWVMQAITEHLEYVTSGDVLRLIVNVPPGPGWIGNTISTARGRILFGEIVVGDKVLTHKGRYRAVTDIYERGVMPMVKVTVHSGRSFLATPDHQIYTSRGYKAANELKPEDVLAVSVPQEDVLPGLVSSEEARLLGYLVGDGSVTHAPTFTNMDDETIADFIHCAAVLGFSTSVRDKKHNRAHVVSLHGARSNKVKEWLKSHGLKGKSSYTKFIPSKVLNSNKDVLRNFIGAYWSCDGMIEVRKTMARGSSFRSSCSTVSRRLADDLQHALMRFGITSRIRRHTVRLESKKQPGGQYVSYQVDISKETETALLEDFPIVARKRLQATLCKRGFPAQVIGDEVVSVEPVEPAECRCITVEEDETLTWNDLVVHNCSKSLLSSVFWPAWEWGPRAMASNRYAAFSYSSTLTERDNDRMMALVCSPEYRENWGDRFSVYGGAVKVKNDKTGWKLATSIAGVGTGERADRLILDDLNNVKEAESKAILQSTNQWIREVMPTRLNHLTKSAVVAIQQRTSEEDCTGTLVQSRDDWTWLMVPMRYDPMRHCVTTIGWSDPRTVEGELCWPERFPSDEVIKLEREMGPYAWAGQMQQMPAPRGGGIIKTEWWQPWEARTTPPLDYIIASLDTAMTEKDSSDYSALTVWGCWQDSGAIVGDEYGGYDFVASNEPREFGEDGRERASVTSATLPKILMLHAWRDRLSLPALHERVLATCLKYKVDSLVVENKAHGHAVMQTLRDLFSATPFSIIPFEPRMYGDKSARLYAIQHLFSEGLVYAPLDKEWAEMVITEVSNFPRGANDDLVDTVSQALTVLRRRGFMPRREEAVRDLVGMIRHKPKARPLYPV